MYATLLRVYSDSSFGRVSRVPCSSPRSFAKRHHGPAHHFTMRFSIPNIPAAVLSNAAQRKTQSVTPSEAVQRIAEFLSSGRAAVLTGAGVSVDSGLKAYRGEDGRYSNPDFKCAHHHHHHHHTSCPLSLTYLFWTVPVSCQADFCRQSIICSFAIRVILLTFVSRI